MLTAPLRNPTRGFFFQDAAVIPHLVDQAIRASFRTAAKHELVVRLRFASANALPFHSFVWFMLDFFLSVIAISCVLADFAADFSFLRDFRQILKKRIFRRARPSAAPRSALRHLRGQILSVFF